MEHGSGGAKGDKRAAELLLPLSYDPKEQFFFCADNTLGMGWICHPLAGGDDALTDNLNTLLNQDWPTDTIFQVALWTSPDLHKQLDMVRDVIHRQDNELLSRSMQERINFLEGGTGRPLVPELPVRVRDIKIIVTCRVPCSGLNISKKEAERALDLRRSLYQALQTAYLSPQAMTAGMYIHVMNTMLSWGDNASWRSTRVRDAYDPHELVREQVFDFDSDIRIVPGRVMLGDKCATSLSIKRYPKMLDFGIATRFLGDAFASNRIVPENCLISMTMIFPDHEKRRAELDKPRGWVINQSQGNLIKFLPRLGEVKDGFDALYEAFNEGDRSVEAYLGVVHFTDTPEDAMRATSNIRALWRELGIQLMEDKYFVLPLLQTMLPMSARKEQLQATQRFKTMATRHVVTLLPVFADWKGSSTPLLNLVSRRGQLMSLCNFDSETNYNLVIAAESGSGKSFLANEIISALLAMQGQIWVIDAGRSYKNLCARVGGQFIEFTEKSNICLNPFTLVKDYEDEADVLTGLLKAMAAPTVPLTDLQSAELSRVLKIVWDKNLQATEIDHVADALLAEEDPRVSDVGTQLYPFTSKGEYGKWFVGRNNIDVDSPFTVLELDELKGRKHLQQVVLLQLMYQIQQTVYGGFLENRDRLRMLLVDEAWDLLSKGDIAKFVEDFYRRMRKYLGGTGIITQSINDLYSNPSGVAIAENSASMYLLGQKRETIEALAETKRLDLGPAGFELLRSVKTAKGVYSEIFAMTNNGAGAGRLIVEDFRKFLYSTNAQETAHIERQIQAGMSLEKAIQDMVTAKSHKEGRAA